MRRTGASTAIAGTDELPVWNPTAQMQIDEK
jgi:hypothetical protein